MLEEQNLGFLRSCSLLGEQRVFGEVLHILPGLCTLLPQHPPSPRLGRAMAPAQTVAGPASLQPPPSSISLGKLQGRLALGLPQLGLVLLAKAPAPRLTCAMLMYSIL